VYQRGFRSECNVSEVGFGPGGSSRSIKKGQATRETNFTAFANLPLWLSWILCARGHFTAARVTSAIALFLSLETVQLFVQPYRFDEAASREGYLAAPHIGFFCWAGSMFVILFASNRALRRRSSDPFAASNQDEQ
jgi:hypothetical protein